MSPKMESVGQRQGRAGQGRAPDDWRTTAGWAQMLALPQASGPGCEPSRVWAGGQEAGARGRAWGGTQGPLDRDCRDCGASPGRLMAPGRPDCSSLQWGPASQERWGVLCRPLTGLRWGRGQQGCGEELSKQASSTDVDVPR